MGDGLTVVEVFAGVACPFTHVGLRRFVERRRDAGASTLLHVRSWPLELVNGHPMDPTFIAAEVAEIRPQVAPDLFRGFRADAFPSTSLPALALAAAAYRVDVLTGEAVSLALRDALFEQGRDIADPAVLHELAQEHAVDDGTLDTAVVAADWEEGQRRGVLGSPHYFTPAGAFFCPSLHITRVDGHLRITGGEEFDRFLDECFGA